MTPRSVRTILIGVALAASITAILVINFELDKSAGEQCLPYRGRGKPSGLSFIPMNIILGCFLMCCVVGIVWLLVKEDYLVGYVIYLLANIILVLALVAVLIVYLIQVSPTNHKWEQDLVARGRWQSVKNCLVRIDFCDHFPGGGCCTEPIQCHNTNTVKIEKNDCKLWKNKKEELCYMCSACKNVIFNYQKAYSSRMKVAIIIYVVILVVVTVIQILEFWIWIHLF